MIRTGSDFSGVGAFDQALSRLGIEQDKVWISMHDKPTYITTENLSIILRMFMIEKYQPIR